jgi:alkylhydroperoxidase family enzyme
LKLVCESAAVARMPYVEREQAPERVRAALERVPDLNIFRLMANAPTAFVPWLRFASTLLAELELDPLLRELAILRVAALTPGAEYEWVQHEAIARAVGATDAQVEGARSGEGLSGDDDLVAAFTEQVVRDARPDEATWARASERFSPRELVELLLVIGQYMMLGRVMATAQIDMDLPASDSVLSGARRSAERAESGGATPSSHA